MKRFVIVLILLLLIPCKVYALDSETYNDVLSEYDLSFFKDELDGTSYSLLSDLGLDDFDYSRLTSLSFKDVLNAFKSISADKLILPLKSMLSVLILIVLSALFQSLKPDGGEEMSSVYSTCTALVISVVLIAQMSSSITAAATSIKMAGSFIFAFVPVFCAIVVASGGITTSFSTNSMLLMLSQGLSFISANIFMPLINCFLALGICSSLRKELNLDNLVGSLRKGITSLISVVCSVFISILSIKTSVSARADALGIRSVRFVINSVVPVIGGSVSEGLLSIQSYSSLIKSSVGIIGIIAIALLFLPSVLEIAMWRLVLSISLLFSEVFGDASVCSVLRAFKDTALLINVVLILSTVTTVISFGILIAARTV